MLLVRSSHLVGRCLGHFLFLYLEKKQTTRNSTNEAIEKALVFWEKANIPVKYKLDAIKKLESMLRR